MKENSKSKDLVLIEKVSLVRGKFNVKFDFLKIPISMSKEFFYRMIANDNVKVIEN